MKTASTYLGLSEYRSGNTLSDFLHDDWTPRCEGTVEEVVAYLEGLRGINSHDEPLTWEGRNGTFYTGSDAEKRLEKEIAALKDGSHSSLEEDTYFLLSATYMWHDRAGMGGDYAEEVTWFENEAAARAAFAAFQEEHKTPAMPYMEGATSKADHQTAALFAYNFNQPFSQELDRKDAEDERNLDCWQQPIAWN